MDHPRAGRGSGLAPLRSLIQNGLILALSLLFCLAILEIGTRILVEGQPRRWQIHDLDPQKKIAFLPESEHRYQSEEFDFTLRTNQQGRRDREWTAATLSDPRNVLFIGDSLILGYGVEDEWTLPTLLEAERARAGDPREFFNFGLPGGNPADYVALFDEARRIGIRARTTVVAIFVGNDFFPNVGLPGAGREMGAPEPSGWRPRSEFVVFVKRRVSQSPRMIGWALTLGRWLGLSVYGTAGSYIFLREQTPEQRATFQRILGYVGELKQRCEESGCDLRVVVIPNKMQIEHAEDLSGAIYDATKPNRLVLEYCDASGIACLDLQPPLSAAHVSGGPPLYFPIDRHLTPRGAEVAAGAIADFLWSRQPE